MMLTRTAIFSGKSTMGMMNVNAKINFDANVAALASQTSRVEHSLHS